MEELVLEMIRSNITSSNELGEKVQAMSINSETAKSVDVAKETEHNFEGKLRHIVLIQQVKIVDSKGNLKTVYPSRVDLNFGDSAKLKVARHYTD